MEGEKDQLRRVSLEDLPCSWICRVNIVKWPSYQKVQCNTNQNSNVILYRP